MYCVMYGSVQCMQHVSKTFLTLFSVLNKMAFCLLLYKIVIDCYNCKVIQVKDTYQVAKYQKCRVFCSVPPG